MRHVASLLVLSLVVALARPAVATVLLTDDFSVGSVTAETFNDTLASTQGGSLATVTYNVQGVDFVAQHGNGNAMLLANSGAPGFGYGNVSLNNDFAGNANSANAPLTISFNIVTVTGYTDGSRWVQFNLGGAQNLAVGDNGVGVGIYFTQFGDGSLLSGGSLLPSSSFRWSPSDLVSITLSDTAGTGSAFNSNGSRATVQVGATTVGTFTLAQQSIAYANFSAYNYSNDQFGYGQFDNLSVSVVAVPEPSMALFGVAAAVGLVVRRRTSRAG